MSRKVFFSFHFDRDVWRAGQIRNANQVAKDDTYGVIDGVDWEKIERQGDPAIKRWIDDQLKDTSVTVVLIGAETAGREWVEYEIRKSWQRGNALVGLRIHNVKNVEGNTDSPGPNPLDSICLTNGTRLSTLFKTYDWVSDDGRANLGDWVEKAYQTRRAYTGEDELSEGASATASSTITTHKSEPGFAPRSPWSANEPDGRQ